MKNRSRFPALFQDNVGKNGAGYVAAQPRHHKRSRSRRRIPF